MHLSKRSKLRVVMVGFLAGATILASVVILIIAKVRQRSTSQAKAIGEIESVGGLVTYQHEWDNDRNCPSNTPVGGNAPIRLLFGPQYYLIPRGILIANFKGKFEFFESLKVLTDVSELAIIDSPEIDDRIIDYVLELEHLQSLSLAGTAVTSQGISRLSELQSLRSIILIGTSISNEDLERLRKQMPHCDFDNERNTAELERTRTQLLEMPETLRQSFVSRHLQNGE